LSKGGIASTTVDVRLLLRKALEVGATSIILAHNHPTGNIQPSRANKLLTAKIQKATKVIDIQLLDHLIVSENGYFSFADENML
jgi:DNA repair protein RadC